MTSTQSPSRPTENCWPRGAINASWSYGWPDCKVAVAWAARSDLSPRTRATRRVERGRAAACSGSGGSGRLGRCWSSSGSPTLSDDFEQLVWLVQLRKVCNRPYYDEDFLSSAGTGGGPVPWARWARPPGRRSLASSRSWGADGSAGAIGVRAGVFHRLQAEARPAIPDHRALALDNDKSEQKGRCRRLQTLYYETNEAVPGKVSSRVSLGESGPRVTMVSAVMLVAAELDFEVIRSTTSARRRDRSARSSTSATPSGLLWAVT